MADSEPSAEIWVLSLVASVVSAATVPAVFEATRAVTSDWTSSELLPVAPPMMPWAASCRAAAAAACTEATDVLALVPEETVDI